MVNMSQLQRISFTCFLNRIVAKKIARSTSNCRFYGGISRLRNDFIPTINIISNDKPLLTNYKYQNNLATPRNITTSPTTCKKKKPQRTSPPPEERDPALENDILEDEEFDGIRSRLEGLEGLEGLEPGTRDVMVVQPWVKWGPAKKQHTTADLMLEEAVTLVATLPGVRVSAQEIVPVKTLSGKIFGSGTLERLASLAHKHRTSHLFVSVNLLKKAQLTELEAALRMRVWDRYSVVLSIFQQNARTREAKLQVALAELPYIRKRLAGERERLIVMEREKKILSALSKLAGNRALIRRARVKSSLPTVAVVGYTNSGKTSLIRAITGDQSVEGKDSLFATLDVTSHGGRLPCGVQVAFIDTVGFIQDIPTDLVASFRATLEDAVCADVVVHVRDVSHPDYAVQGLTVEQTLASLPLPAATPVITAANKADKLQDKGGFHEELMVSATTGEGVVGLLERVQEAVLGVTGRRVWRFKLPTGSHQIQWLRRVTGLASEHPDPDDPQTTIVTAAMTDQEMAAFNRNFAARKT